MKKIVLTGGGTAGHVTPNIALFPALKEAGYEISYIRKVDSFPFLSFSQRNASVFLLLFMNPI